MKRKAIGIWLLVLLLIAGCLGVGAEEVFLPYVADYREAPMDISLTEELNSYASKASQECGVDVVFALFDTVGDPVETAASVYLQGSNFDGDTVLLVVAESTPKYTVYVKGDVSGKLDAVAKEEIFAAYNNASDYETGIKAYVDAVRNRLSAAPTEPTVSTNGAAVPTQAVRLTDEASLFTPTEVGDINDRLDEISERRLVDVTVAVMPADYSDSLEAYAASVYAAKGYAANGVMLVLHGEEHGVLAFGNMKTVLTAEQLKQIDEEVTGYLQKKDPFLAVDIFVALVDSSLSAKTTTTAPSSEATASETDTLATAIGGAVGVIDNQTGVIVGVVVAVVAAAAVAIAAVIFVRKKHKKA